MNAKERHHQKLEKTRKESSQSFRGSTALLILWFWTPSLQKCETVNFCCVSHQVRYSSPRKLKQGAGNKIESCCLHMHKENWKEWNENQSGFLLGWGETRWMKTDGVRCLSVPLFIIVFIFKVIIINQHHIKKKLGGDVTIIQCQKWRSPGNR